MSSNVEIRKQAELYLEGKSLREIGAMFGINHGIVSTNLTQELRNIDLGLYDQVMQKINEKNSKKLSNPEVQKLILNEIEMYLCGASVDQIANYYGRSYDAVYHDLTQRSIRLSEMLPETLSRYTVEVVRDLLKQSRLDNLSIGNNGTYKNQKRDNGKFSK